MFKKGEKKRKKCLDVDDDEGNASLWSQVKSRQDFWQKVPDELRQQVIQFIRDHHHVINSPIARDTNRIPDPNKKGKWIRKTSCYYNVQCVSY